MVKRVVVGAHYGLRDWLVQRVSAVVMAVYTVLLAVVLVAAPPLDYADWKALFAHQWMRFATLLFFLSLFLHAWVGMRDILMDYVHPTGLRLALQVAVVLSLVFYAVWTVQVLWSV
jgi:succinate dehydrogenase / fumarate reductase membrane anchor subunit